jgi:hypothetical protein
LRENNFFGYKKLSKVIVCVFLLPRVVRRERAERERERDRETHANFL